MTVPRAEPAAEAARGRRWGHTARAALGVAVSALCLWLAIRNVPGAGLAAALGRPRPPLLAAAVAVELLLFAALAARWQRLFPSPGAPTVARLFGILTAAQLANAVLPARLGPLMRAMLAGRGTRGGVAAAATTLAGEKVLEGLSVLLIAAALAPFVPLAGWLRPTASAGAVLLAALLVAAGILARRWTSAGRLPDRLLGRWPRLLDLGRHALAALDVWREGRSVVVLWLWTAAVWVLTVLVNQLVLWAFGIHVPAAAAVAITVALRLGVHVPSLPAGVGILHYLAVATLSLYGIDRGTALAYGIVLHLVIYVPGALLGALYLGRTGYRLGGLVRPAGGGTM